MGELNTKLLVKLSYAVWGVCIFVVVVVWGMMGIGIPKYVTYVGIILCYFSGMIVTMHLFGWAKKQKLEFELLKKQMKDKKYLDEVEKRLKEKKGVKHEIHTKH